MKKILTISTAFFALSQSNFAADPHVWTSFGSNEYALTIEPAFWTDAEAEAISVGGHLASIHDVAQNAFVSGYGGYLWIGFNDAASEGTFAWSDGSPADFTNWEEGEPNNYSDFPFLLGEDYAVTNWGLNDNGRTWNDLSNDYPEVEGRDIYGVIERPLEQSAVPEVQTYATLFGVALVGLKAIRRKRP